MMRSKALVRCGLVLLSLWLCTQSVPIGVDQKQEKPLEEQPESPQSADTGLHYDRYLREVVENLEKDPHFKEKLKNINMDELKQGKIAKELDFVHNNFRTKLDELKREELSRLRLLIRAKHDLKDGNGRVVDHHALLRQFEHLNHKNPDTFEVDDLDRLIKAATKDMENFDKQRHDEFKNYEMMKEHERRERLKSMDEEHRKMEEEHYAEMKKKHGDHPKVNHPGSEAQLKDVWEETDGLDRENFNPKTFFVLHDINGDGYLDDYELEALFTKELGKLYDPKNEEDDMFEMEEERLRMKEQVMKEVDKDKDGLVSLAEFLSTSQSSSFQNNDDWETLDENPIYSEDELKIYEEHLEHEKLSINNKTVELQKQREELDRQQQMLDDEKLQLQQTMEHVENMKSQNATIQVKDSAASSDTQGSVLQGNAQPLSVDHEQQGAPAPGHS
ncbi:nucleobindin-2-like [Genypterus blacodes]|uniref:nucleobindin-2-like n=1 Tax=Genypterus blacodes TaxID=154954 RepID=UPI003F760C10